MEINISSSTAIFLFILSHHYLPPNGSEWPWGIQRTFMELNIRPFECTHCCWRNGFCHRTWREFTYFAPAAPLNTTMLLLHWGWARSLFNPLGTGNPETGHLTNSEDPAEMWHFIRSAPIAKAKSIPREIYTFFFLEIMIGGPSIIWIHCM